MPDGSISYAIKDKNCFILLTGRITYKMSLSFDALISCVLQKDNISYFLFDLRQVQHIDSTGLGSLAKIAIFLSKKGKDRPIILSHNENVDIVLDSMGFFDVFLIIDSSVELSDQFEEVCDTFKVDKDQTAVILQAHEALMFLNEKNKDTFKDVVALLKNELEEN